MAISLSENQKSHLASFHIYAFTEPKHYIKLIIPRLAIAFCKAWLRDGVKMELALLKCLTMQIGSIRVIAQYETYA